MSLILSDFQKKTVLQALETKGWRFCHEETVFDFPNEDFKESIFGCTWFFWRNVADDCAVQLFDKCVDFALDVRSYTTEMYRELLSYHGVAPGRLTVAELCGRFSASELNDLAIFGGDPEDYDEPIARRLFIEL